MIEITLVEAFWMFKIGRIVFSSA